MTLEEALARLRTGSPDERRAALELIGATADARVTPVVAACLHDPDPELVTLAEATLWRIWARWPDPAVAALFAEGMRAMARRDWLGAVAVFGRVIQAAPEFAEAWNQRATARYLAEHYASAIADCETVVQLNPYHFGALAGQGLCHAALRQYRDAARCFRGALRIHPRLHGVREQLARVEGILVRGNGQVPETEPGAAQGGAAG